MTNVKRSKQDALATTPKKDAMDNSLEDNMQYSVEDGEQNNMVDGHA